MATPTAQSVASTFGVSSAQASKALSLASGGSSAPTTSGTGYSSSGGDYTVTGNANVDAINRARADAAANGGISNAAINGINTAPASPIPIAPKPATPNYASVFGNNAAFASPTQQYNPQTYQLDPVQQIEQERKQGFMDSIAALAKPVNTADIYQQESDKAQIAQKQQVVNDLTAQLNGITAKAQADHLSLTGQGRGVPEVIIGGQQAQVAKEAAIQALPVQAQLAAAQGNLQLAQQHLDTAFQIRVSDAEAANKQWNDTVKLSYDYFDKSEQRKLDAISKQSDRNTGAINDTLDYAKSLAEKAFTTKNFALGGKITQAALGTTLDPNSPTFQKDLAAFKQTIGKYATSFSSGGGTGSGSGKLSSIAQAVADNPNLLSNLTPTVRGQVINELSQGGYDTTALGTKPLSDAAIKEISQSNTALTSIADLKTIVSNNIDKLGPITGFAALNPWSEARKVQADIDRVKQQVGKALEGGVLRKEDEEKYKKILTTINDQPGTAIYKLDQLAGSISQSIEDYKSLQTGAGRSSNVTGSLKKKGDVVTGKTSTGNGYTITKN